ncbi:MAG TPA: hypothetical protein VFU49_14440 [Ktedonobacteraceae bacterium]|nr:hypothetical protein [Ktedonobacteraceae bacterium]
MNSSFVKKNLEIPRSNVGWGKPSLAIPPANAADAASYAQAGGKECPYGAR